MSRAFTVISTQEPDPAAMAWAIADIDPELVITVDEELEVWRVQNEDGEEDLVVIETPSRIQVPGEDVRLFGTRGGLSATDVNPDGLTFWQDVHAVGSDPRADTVAARFSRTMAHLGLGTCIQHGNPFTDLSQEGDEQRGEWR